MWWKLEGGREATAVGEEVTNENPVLPALAECWPDSDDRPGEVQPPRSMCYQSATGAKGLLPEKSGKEMLAGLAHPVACRHTRR